jgi:hypothetical protein
MSGPETEQAIALESRPPGAGAAGRASGVGLVEGTEALERWRAYLWGLGWQVRFLPRACLCVHVRAGVMERAD